MVIELSAKSLLVPGALTITNNIAQFSPQTKEGLFGNQDVSSIISPQFDRMSVRFQQLLKVASVAGLYTIETIRNHISFAEFSHM
jgi:hypothetical protein